MTRLDEFSKEEWRDVVRRLKPELSDEEFEKDWREFIEWRQEYRNNLKRH